ncbi:glycosyl transferase family 1 [Gammaproteobacteria bacterium 50_400_T64]|nr:glycosyl transferase family 1 [Gammaproteobacteria bacterium 50_400_T64]
MNNNTIMNKAMTKKTVLFVAEAVTLAHFGRMMTLARSLDPTQYRIVVASDPRYLSLEQPFPFDFEPLWTIPGEQFARALAKGQVVYDTKTLARYIEDDLQVLAKIKPDLVVGDFRLSLAVSAPCAGVPYAAVVNAYWSPFANTAYPVPDLPFTKILGLTLGQQLFNAVRPLAFALHARPLNTLRRRHGLTPIGNDLRKVYTWADHTLYADTPELVPCTKLTPNHHYLGPVLWSTKTDLPPWWDQLPDDKPIVFASPGSSGQVNLLSRIIHALRELCITLVVATAGRGELVKASDNVFTADYLPIQAVIQKSQLIICNGGSLTTYEALKAGVPILGLTSNMDQQLNMQAIKKTGAGITLRSQSSSDTDIAQAANTLLTEKSYHNAAKQAAHTLSRYDSSQRFQGIVAKLVNE